MLAGFGMPHEKQGLGIRAVPEPLQRGCLETPRHQEGETHSGSREAEVRKASPGWALKFEAGRSCSLLWQHRRCVFFFFPPTAIGAAAGRAHTAAGSGQPLSSCTGLSMGLLLPACPIWAVGTHEDRSAPGST